MASLPPESHTWRLVRLMRTAFRLTSALKGRANRVSGSGVGQLLYVYRHIEWLGPSLKHNRRCSVAVVVYAAACGPAAAPPAAFAVGAPGTAAAGATVWLPPTMPDRASDSVLIAIESLSRT
jgi:hypothetical protein